MLKISYAEFISDCHLLAAQVARSGKHYKNIYAIPRGGVPVALILQQTLGLPLISKDEIVADTLIVDDLIDSGRTLNQFPDNDKAVVFTKAAEAPVNYSVEIVEGWIEFPYEQTDRDEEDNIVRMLETLGEDASREGLRDTPKRVMKFYREFLSPEDFNFTTFEGENYDEMIIQKDIPFFSLCEHHLAPFFGTATVAYIPNGKIVGLSKLARTVDLYARRFQNQERITSQIAERLQEELQPNDRSRALELVCIEYINAAPGTTGKGQT